MTSEAETMVERIARALCVDEGDDPEREGPFSEWFKESPYFISAKAVLTALLDPTEEMVEAAKPWPAHWPKDGPDFPVRRAAYLADQMTLHSQFRAMIQAALQPGSKSQ